MKKLLLIVALFACGGEAVTKVDELPPGYYDIPTEELPGQEGRIDGSVWTDGMFRTPEDKREACQMLPSDAWFCQDLGSAEQAWTSHQGHGIRAGGGSCYGPQSTNTSDCKFPQLKQFKLSFDGSACKSHSTHGTDTLPVVQRPTAPQLTAMVEGFVAGVFNWNDAGTDVKVQPVATAPSGYDPLVIKCGAPFTSTSALAEATIGLGDQDTQVSDLPTAPNGKNARKAIVYDEGEIVISAKNLWKQILASCSTGGQWTIANIKASAKWVGRHEGGHVMGFGEFDGTSTSNPMKPFYPGGCAPVGSIGSAFTNALGNYESTPESGANATIVIGSLPGQSPQ